MSLKTKLLELFKYEPDKDGAQTFNIKSALNDNWDKIEAWAQSVKTALTKLVPTSRKVNGKALTEDVTLTGDDIAMGADDTESLRAAMAKRLVAEGNVRRFGSIATTWDNEMYALIIGIKSGGFFEVYNDYACRTQLTITPPTKGTFVTARLGQTFDGEQWEVAEIATRISPERHELPLASDFPEQPYSNSYYKTQEGIVHLNFCITRGSSTAFTASEVVCTLPIGYRPSSVRMFSVGGDSGYFSTVAAPVQVYVTSDGELKFISCAQKVTWIYGEITYLAG